MPEAPQAQPNRYQQNQKRTDSEHVPVQRFGIAQPDQQQIEQVQYTDKDEVNGPQRLPIGTADAGEPGLEIRAAIERPERAKDLQKDVLCEIFGAVGRADECVRDVEDLAPMLLDDDIPGRLVALQATGDENVDGVRRCVL